MTSPTDSQTPEELDRRVHLSHCYQGENLDNCKYGDEDCPAKPQTTESQDTIFINWLNRVIDDASQPDMMINADNLYHLQLKPLMTAESLAAQKALLDKLQVSTWRDDNTKMNITRHDFWQYIEAERQQLGKESSDE